jgi:hypothetical protein
MRTRGAIRVQARCIKVANKSDADQKEVKALFETKSADVRMSANTEKFIECLDKPRREIRGVDKTCRVADRIPFKRTKVDLPTPQLREELRARSLDFDAATGHENACAMLKDFERNKTCVKPIMTEFFKEMMQDETTDD